MSPEVISSLGLLLLCLQAAAVPVFGSPRHRCDTPWVLTAGTKTRRVALIVQ